MFGRHGDSIRSLRLAVEALHDDAPDEAGIADIITRRNFRPSEDEAIGIWFARFLTVRQGLWDVIDEVMVTLDKPLSSYADDTDLRAFIVGYAASCLLVRMDRLLLFGVAEHSVIQRKLNEAFPEYRIPRKQYTKIFSAFVDYKNVMAIRDAMQFANKHRAKLMTFRDDEHVGFIVSDLAELESSLNPSARRHVRRAWSYISHKWRRRGAVTAHNILAKLLEGVGRTAAEVADLKNKSVTPAVRESIGAFLEPGDVIITRHAKALTNLFIPGFWPHAALYIGTPAQVEGANIERSTRVDSLWLDDICVLEARKDGVRLRSLEETLSVDKFVVLRPNLKRGTVHEAIGRALTHQGKLYNFDFDFFSSDRIVCTEVIYRAYDGLANIRFPLSERAGRQALSAEALVDFALDKGVFHPVAIFGVNGCRDKVLYGEGCESALVASYRPTE